MRDQAAQREAIASSRFSLQGRAHPHRSHAIDVRHLRGTKAGPNGHLAELAGGFVLPIGRAYASELRAMTDGAAAVV